MQFQAPSAAIHEESDLEEFKRSGSFKEIVSFIKACSESVIGIPIPSSSSSSVSPTSSASSDSEESSIFVSDVIRKCQNYMVLLGNLIDEIPPLHQPMRYGNKAFRDWHARLIQETEIFLTALLPSELNGAKIELSAYLNQSFGNETRIDYGTGHELTLIIFYLCLYKLNVLTEKDFQGIVCIGFHSYIQLMRKLQEVYMLEPAGSHGVWGLDDYHCLTFVFGAAQLIGHESITPSSMNNPEILKQYSSQYLYLEGISFIKRIKCKAPFHETSPMLHDISGLEDWAKVYNGLLRLFQGEVLSKLPVIQHLHFGSVLPRSWTPTTTNYISAAAAVGGGGLTTIILTEDHIKSIQARSRSNSMRSRSNSMAATATGAASPHTPHTPMGSSCGMGSNFNNNNNNASLSSSPLPVFLPPILSTVTTNTVNSAAVYTTHISRAPWANNNTNNNTNFNNNNGSIKSHPRTS